ncbi:MAG TPA: hypothetical protein GXZ26_01625 [Firmicutes bacterium]|jgi:hypothetical protein|nr:hypothetical protein [Bacillota bacterium]
MAKEGKAQEPENSIEVCFFQEIGVRFNSRIGGSMDAEDRFLKHWFSGVNCFIDHGSDEEVNHLLSRCAKGCSDSFSLRLYQRAFSDRNNIKDSLDYLAEHFEDFSYNILPDRIQIIYNKCGCDLYRKGLIVSKKLCICSEKSLLYNWESVFGQNKATVIRKNSILNGDESCVFEVRMDELGHPN